MKELWNEASKYGRVNLRTSDDGAIVCNISFNTIEHVELVARSTWTCTTPEQALSEAINKAKQIVNSMHESIQKFKELANGESTST
jgi:hypothetical protein